MKIAFVFLAVLLLACVVAPVSAEIPAQKYLSYDNHDYNTTVDLGTSKYFGEAIFTNTGKVVSFASNGTIYYSTDGISFSQSNMGSLGIVNMSLYGQNLDSNGDVIIGGEYDVTAAPHRIIRSTDGGATWSSVLGNAWGHFGWPYKSDAGVCAIDCSSRNANNRSCCCARVGLAYYEDR